MARLKEYAFLLLGVLLAALYAVPHDQLTATISPEYFVYGKGLDSPAFRWAVARLAVRASLPVGLLGAAALLIANNPRHDGPAQLEYRTLRALLLLPLPLAALTAVAFGAANSFLQIGAQTAASLGVPAEKVPRFDIVWAMHLGSYVGALVGIIVGALWVAARRRRGRDPRAQPPPIGVRWRRGLLPPLTVGVAVYALLCLVVRVRYRDLLYPIPKGDQFDAPAGVQVLSLRGEDGALTIAAELAPPDDQARTVVVFHGNGETIAGRLGLAEALHRLGLGVVLAEFRGYGLARAAGPPDEAGLYRDASAILDELQRQNIGSARVALLGISLGTGVAVEMAARGRGASLILVSPYTSITEMARTVAPWLPTRWVCPDRFDSLSKAAQLRLPTLVIHGDRDEVVPFAMGRQLAAAIPGARLRVVPGAGHNDLFASTGPELERAIAEAAKR